MKHIQKEHSFDLSVIIVNHNSDKFLNGCISSLLQNINNISFEIIVVDNGAQNFSSQNFGISLTYIPLDSNRGFGHANNVGASCANGKYLLFLNPDTEIHSGKIEKLIAILNKYPKIGIIGPQLISDNEKIQPWCVGYEVSPWDTIFNNIGLSRSKHVWSSKSARPVHWISGASILIRKELFEQINGFDENYFLYFEDVDLCKRTILSGFYCYYEPSVKIKHFGGKSMPSNNFQKSFYYESQDYYFKKHFGIILSQIMKFFRKLTLFFKHD